MYESFFELHRRPFASLPDPQCWFSAGPYQAAFDELLICAEQGQGVGLLIAPAGTGKTLVCERLIHELESQFSTVLLRHTSEVTRRALLQSLLSELDLPYDKSSDHELRLSLIAELRKLSEQGRALLLVVDEAHTLDEPLLEELRILSDQSREGRSLVRLVLAGQVSLEERLAHPALAALNQRVRAHVILPTLSLAESLDYIDFRITWAGGRTDELFDAEALQLIARASDGAARCLNQLCDHALLIGYVAGQRPVTQRTVAEALDDLRHLPLPWNPVATDCPHDFEDDAPPVIETGEYDDEGFEEELVEDDPNRPATEIPFYRLSRDLDTVALDDSSVFDDGTPEEWDLPISPLTAADEEFTEEEVLDRYVALDAGLQPPLELPAAPLGALPVFDLPEPVLPLDRLDALRVTIDQVLETSSPVGSGSLANQPLDRRRSPEERLGADVLELCQETDAQIQRATAVSPAGPQSVVPLEPAESTVFEFGAEAPPAPLGQVAAPAEASSATTSRSYRNLFTMLRRKQQGRA